MPKDYTMRNKHVGWELEEIKDVATSNLDKLDQVIKESGEEEKNMNDEQIIKCPHCSYADNNFFLRDIHCINPYDIREIRSYIRKAVCPKCNNSFTLGIKFSSYVISKN